MTEVKVELQEDLRPPVKGKVKLSGKMTMLK